MRKLPICTTPGIAHSCPCLLLHVQFDVTFPKMPCSWLSLDAMDISGEMHLDVVSIILHSVEQQNAAAGRLQEPGSLQLPQQHAHGGLFCRGVNRLGIDTLSCVATQQCWHESNIGEHTACTMWCGFGPSNVNP